MGDSAGFRAKAARCRRLAETFTTTDDKARAALLAMAEEFERLAREAPSASDTQEDGPEL